MLGTISSVRQPDMHHTKQASLSMPHRCVCGSSSEGAGIPWNSMQPGGSARTSSRLCLPFLLFHTPRTQMVHSATVPKLFLQAQTAERAPLGGTAGAPSSRRRLPASWTPRTRTGGLYPCRSCTGSGLSHPASCTRTRRCGCRSAWHAQRLQEARSPTGPCPPG